MRIFHATIMLLLSISVSTAQELSENQRKGVKIDIEVKPTIQGINDGGDEVLERAISYLDQQIQKGL